MKTHVAGQSSKTGMCMEEAALTAPESMAIVCNMMSLFSGAGVQKESQLNNANFDYSCGASTTG